jgi:ankyrin repeat protein
MRFYTKCTGLLLVSSLVAGCLFQDNLYRSIQTGNLTEFQSQIEKKPERAFELTPEGDNPLNVAAFYGETEMVRLLLSKGADINAQDRWGDTPLHTAISLERLPTATLLLDSGANIAIRNRHGQTVLHKVAMTQWVDFTQKLLAAGAKVGAGDNKQETALHYVAMRSDVSVARVLVQSGANVNAKSSEKNTPLHLAARRGAPLELITFFIEKGADINAANETGSTPLHLACSFGKIEAIELLVKKGANVDALDEWGNTPLAVAERAGIHWIGLAKSLGKKSPQNQLAGKQAPMLNKAGADVAPAPSNSSPEIKKTGSSSTIGQTNPSEGVKLGKSSENEFVKPLQVTQLELGKYFALVIGINNYVYLPKLKTAVNDARTVEALLNNTYGFETRLLVDPDRGQILKSLNVMRRKLSSTDNLLVYYAGHGWLDRDADEGYWLPVDADADSNINWVANSAITATLRAMDAKHVLVVSDSCYSGKLSRGIYVKDETPGYYRKIVSKRARTVLSSGGLEPVADASYGSDHSVFAKYFIRALQENETLIDGLELFLKIRRPVMINSDQAPEYADIRKAGHDGGDFIFRRLK